MHRTSNKIKIKLDFGRGIERHHNQQHLLVEYQARSTILWPPSPVASAYNARPARPGPSCGFLSRRGGRGRFLLLTKIAR